MTRFALALGEGQQFTADNNQSLAVSPDGTQLVYVANNQLYLRSMSDLEARPIPGTQQTPTPCDPGVFTGRPVHRLLFSGGQSDQEDRRQRRSGGHDLSGRHCRFWG